MDRSEQIEFFHHVDRFTKRVDELNDLIVRLEKVVHELNKVLSVHDLS